ncbi:MAG: hypothetical protein MJZ70_02270 [Bacteroidales bacterium]|nr:hypothetical protein [Bacteroidales bacterium]
MKKLLILSILAVIMLGCHTTKKAPKTSEAPETPKQEMQKPVSTASIASPPTIIYKTTKDYSQYVPVGYADKKIKSFPAPTDVRVGDKLMTPTALRDGYWLDNRGISPQVAFLSYTYKEYAELPSTPGDLYQRLLDTDPIIEMWECGPRHTYSDPAKEINQLIKEGNLESRCRKLK